MNTARHENVEKGPTLNEVDEALQPISPALAAALAENHHAFLQFLIRRLRDESTAEDVLQSFYLRAVNRGADLRDNESALAWLYRVLRSVLTDHYRTEAARRRREDNYAQEQILLGDDRNDNDSDESICACLSRLLPTLRPDYAEILRRVDLSGETREEVAAGFGITITNVRVRLHRARQALLKALKSFCGDCCKRSFLDCTCSDAQSPAIRTSSQKAGSSCCVNI